MIKLFKRRAIWLPTWPMALLLLAGALLLSVLILLGSHRFLGVHQPAPGAEVLVVECWLGDSSLSRVADLMNEPDSPYRYAWLAGTKITHGGLANERFETVNEVAAATLELQGVERERLRVAPGPDTARHRTYSAAAALKQELAARGETLERFDLVSLGVHSRRSRLVYEKVFPDADVGVISVPNPAYDGVAWYRTSVGVKNTIFEVVAYLYEKIGDSGR